MVGFRRLAGALLLISGALATGCADREPPSLPGQAGGTITVTDDVGRPVSLDSPARRIISLLPATTETVVALGGRELLVGRTDYEDPELSALPSVGGGLTPSLEMIASLRPDLVIAWEEAGTARIRPRLEELGIEVFAAQTRDTLDIYANIRRLGELTGRSAQADSLLDEVRSGLTSVRASVRGLPSPSVLYLVGVDPAFVAGPRLFIGEMVEVAGGRNAFPELEAESPQMSIEEIVSRRPDLVLFAATDTVGQIARLVAQPGWSELARGGTRFEVLPADVMHRPGPSMVRAAERLRDAIHPQWRSGGA